MLRRRILAVCLGGLFVVALASASAAARSNTTITETCSDGTVIVVDAHAVGGLTTAETHFNEVNPSGTTCSLE
jgi:hypothetical protein